MFQNHISWQTNLLTSWMSNTTFDSIYIFCAIWELGQSQDCVAHSQNPEIAFQSRDCTPIEIAFQSQDCAPIEIAFQSRDCAPIEIAFQSRDCAPIEIAFQSRDCPPILEIAQHMSTISRSRDSHVQSIIMSELSTFPVYLTAHRSLSEVNRHLLLPLSCRLSSLCWAVIVNHIGISACANCKFAQSKIAHYSWAFSRSRNYSWAILWSHNYSVQYQD